MYNIEDQIRTQTGKATTGAEKEYDAIWSHKENEEGWLVNDYSVFLMVTSGPVIVHWN